MGLAAGKLSLRLALLRPVATAGALNSTTTAHAFDRCIWAGKRDAGGLERVRAAELGAVIDARFIVRAGSVPADFDPRWRIECAPRRGVPPVQYDVVSIVEAETAWGQPLAPGEALEISARARAEAVG